MPGHSGVTLMLFSWGRKKNKEASADRKQTRQTEVMDAAVQTQDPEVDEAWQRLEELIKSHPLFRMTTFDGLSWIDPFTTDLVSAPFDLEDTVLAYFRKNEHWRGGKTRTAVQLRALRWQRYMQEDGADDPRLGLFEESGRWYNPWTRQASTSLDRRQQQRGAEWFAKRVSLELAQSPDATPHDMLDFQTLKDGVGKVMQTIPEPEPKAEAGSGSGIRTLEKPAAEPSTAAPSAFHSVSDENTELTAEEAGFNLDNVRYEAVSKPSEEALVGAIQSLRKHHSVSDQDIEERLADAALHQGGDKDSRRLVAAIESLHHRLDGEVADRRAALARELDGTLISLRSENSPEELPGTRRVNHGDDLRYMQAGQLSQEAIDELVGSLRSISLVAEHIEANYSDATIPDGTASSTRYQAVSAPAPGVGDGALTPKPGDELLLPDTPATGIPVPVDGTDRLEAHDSEGEEGDSAGIDREDDLEEDLEKAEMVQHHLLGGLPPVPGVEMALEYQPYSRIGGDFYHVRELEPDRHFFIVGDVSGHGVQAALIVSSIVNSLKIICRQDDLKLVEILSDLNDYMRECLQSGQFFTAFAGIIESGDEGIHLECVCAGHHPTICLNPAAQQPIREIGRLGMGIGLVRSEMFKNQMRPERYELVSGDVLAIYTDGILETMDDNGEELGEQLVRCSLFSHLQIPIADQIDALLGDIAEESDGVVNDDQTILLIRVL
jgi:hypothetical protein